MSQVCSTFLNALNQVNFFFLSFYISFSYRFIWRYEKLFVFLRPIHCISFVVIIFIPYDYGKSFCDEHMSRLLQGEGHAQGPSKFYAC